MVAARHRADLRHRLVAFVDEQQRIVGEIFEQGRRRLAGQAAGQEAAVILDPGAAAGGGDHLQIEMGPLLQPLRLQQPSFRLQFLQPLLQLVADRVHRLLHGRARRHIVAVREHADILQAGGFLAGQRIELSDLLDLVAEEGDPPGAVLIVGREDFQAVAADPEIAPREGLVVALVLQRHELADDLALVDALALLEIEDHRRIGLDRADAVDARDRGDDDHVVAFEQRPGRGMPHPVDRLVHRAFLLDVGIGPGHVGLGLVIIIIADEELDRIVREEALELAVELGRQDLVWGEHQSGPLQRLDHLGGGIGLARAGDAEQHLGLLAGANLLDQLGDRLRLIARRGVIGDDPERLAALDLVRALRTVGDEGLAGFGLVEAGADLDRHVPDMVARARARNAGR